MGVITYNTIGSKNIDVKKQNLSSSKRIKVILISYTIVIIYFMFFGLGRSQISNSIHEYRFQIIPTGIPLWFPKHLSLDILKLWFFSLGNLLVLSSPAMLSP